MKLTDSQVEQVQEETQAQVVPQDDPIAQQLHQEFGEHTFFMDGDGLHVWELIEDEEANTQKLVAVQVAAWKDDQKNVLVQHEPKPFKVLLMGDSGPPDSAA